MTIQKKVTLLFTLLMLFILLLNNTFQFLHFRNHLIKTNERDSIVYANLIAYQINNARESAEYIENRLAKELRSISMAIKDQLPPDYNDVSNEKLKDLANELMISHFTLFAEKGPLK